MDCKSLSVLLFIQLPLLIQAQQSSTTLITGSSTSAALALPTTPYTGQALLTGACDHPQYTPILFANGGQLVVPLIGCSDEHPECCPSLSPPENDSTTTSSQSSSSTASATTTSVSATGIMSMLRQSPLTVCPSDFTDIDPICCPSSYTLHPSPLAGGLRPCVSDLTTAMSIPASVLASISSAIAASYLATATIAQNNTSSTSAPVASVSVEVVQVFALPLPCADKPAQASGMSLGAKIGIGVGVGLGGLLILALAFWAIRRHGRRREEKALNERGTIKGESVPAEGYYNQHPQPMTSNLPVGGVAGAYHDQQFRNQGADTKHTSNMSITSGSTAVGNPGSPLHPGSVGVDYAHGYMHGVQSALAMQHGQSSPPTGWSSPLSDSQIRTGGPRELPGEYELPASERAEMESDWTGRHRAEMGSSDGTRTSRT